MKKWIALAFCFALGSSVMTGCGGNDMKTTDTTTTPGIIITEPTTTSSTPTTTATEPSTIPDSSSVPNDNGTDPTNGGNGAEGNMDRGNNRSRTHAPTVIGRRR